MRSPWLLRILTQKNTPHGPPPRVLLFLMKDYYGMGFSKLYIQQGNISTPVQIARLPMKGNLKFHACDIMSRYLI